jgi:hypothetical protein
VLPFIVRYAKAIPIPLHEPRDFAYNPRLECGTVGESNRIIDGNQKLAFAIGSLITQQRVDTTRDEATDRN